MIINVVPAKYSTNFNYMINNNNQAGGAQMSQLNWKIEKIKASQQQAVLSNEIAQRSQNGKSTFMWNFLFFNSKTELTKDPGDYSELLLKRRRYFILAVNVVLVSLCICIFIYLFY